MKRILRTLALTGIVAAAAAAAQAQIVVGVGVAPVAPVYANEYVPACPGVDYIWTPGYYVGSAWYPGRWAHRGYDHDRYAVYARHDYRFDHAEHFDHRGWDHGRR
jgi:hypothetical protein